MTRPYRKGFTLIELLVVISIVALLSSVALASLNSAREKGRIAKSLHFATQIDRMAGDMVAGVWNFDEVSGTVAVDQTGSGNDGTLYPVGNGPTRSSDTPTNRGTSLMCDGVDDYVLVGPGPTSNASHITVSLWMKTLSLGTGWRKLIGQGPDPTEVFGLYLTSDGYFHVEKGGYYVRTGKTKVNDGRWHHLSYVADGVTQCLYVDGDVGYCSVNYPTIIPNSENVYMCAEKSSATSQYFFDGWIDNVRIFTKGLTAAEVKGIYASESPRYLLADSE